MNEKSFEESMNDINFVKGRAPVFQILYYYVKGDKNRFIPRFSISSHSTVHS